MTDPEFMSWFIQNNDPIPLLEIDDLIEGATTALWIVIKRILIDLFRTYSRNLPHATHPSRII